MDVVADTDVNAPAFAICGPGGQLEPPDPPEEPRHLEQEPLTGQVARIERRGDRLQITGEASREWPIQRSPDGEP